MIDIEKQVEGILTELEIHNMELFKDEINSITFIKMILQLETTFDIIIEEEYFLIDKMGSLESICQYIEERIGEKNEKTEIFP